MEAAEENAQYREERNYAVKLSLTIFNEPIKKLSCIGNELNIGCTFFMVQLPVVHVSGIWIKHSNIKDGQTHKQQDMENQKGGQRGRTKRKMRENERDVEMGGGRERNEKNAV